MNPGKITCEVLKKIRSEIAEANQIDYRSEPCSFKGECIGTCPKCESELQYLEHQLIKKQGSQKTALFAGVSLAIMSGFSACKQSDPAVQNTQTASVKPQTEAVKTEKTNTASNQETLPQNSKKENKKIKEQQETIQLISVDSNKVVFSDILDTTKYISDTLKIDQICYLSDKPVRSSSGSCGGIISSDYIPNYSCSPSFYQQGGNFEKYINKIFKFPLGKKVEKKLMKLQLLIDKTGKIKDVSVLKSIDQELDQQIVKIIKNMPDWNPGEDPNGRPTDTRVKIIIRVTPKKVKVIRQTYDEVEITLEY
jgi:periplasmic protein TonB